MQVQLQLNSVSIHKKRKPNTIRQLLSKIYIYIQQLTKFSLTNKISVSKNSFINTEVPRADSKLQGLKTGANKHWQKTVFKTKFARQTIDFSLSFKQQAGVHPSTMINTISNELQCNPFLVQTFMNKISPNIFKINKGIFTCLKFIK